jgi:hypothetical protein
VFRRYRTLITFLGLALQAADGIVSVSGHSHGDDHSACETHCEQPSCDHCSHHSCGNNKEGTECEQSKHRNSVPSRRDDCTICKHFSQPVVLATVAIEVISSEESEAIPAHYVARFLAAVRPIHPARGPPLVAL